MLTTSYKGGWKVSDSWKKSELLPLFFPSLRDFFSLPGGLGLALVTYQ